MEIKKRNWKHIAVLILAISIGIILLAAFGTEASVDSQKVTLPQYVEIQKQGISLKEELGDDTPYPQFYVMAETLVKIKGMDEDEAAAQAADRYLEKEALVWYAEKSGISIDEAEYADYIDSLIASAKEAENYDEVNSAYKSAGLTLEEHYRENSGFYRDDYLIGKLYEQWTADRVQTDRITADDKDALDAVWQDKVSEIKAEYKASREYRVLQRALSESRELYMKGAGDNLKKLQDADIYFSAPL